MSFTTAPRKASGMVLTGLLFMLRNTHSSPVDRFFRRNDLVCVLPPNPSIVNPPFSRRRLNMRMLTGADHSFR